MCNCFITRARQFYVDSPRSLEPSFYNVGTFVDVRPLCCNQAAIGVGFASDWIRGRCIRP